VPPIGSLLFAAGRGKRLRPLSDVVPKPAIPLLDVPLGAWGLGDLGRGAPPVLVNVSHFPEQVIEALRPFAPGGLLDSMFEPRALGTAGTLRAVARRLRGPLVTRNADLLADDYVAELLEAHGAAGAEATVLLEPVARGADFSMRGETITGFIDRQIERDAVGARFAGMAVFEADVVRHIPAGQPHGLGETVLRTLAENGGLAACITHGYVRDVGTPSDYLAASLDLVAGRAPPPPDGWPGTIVDVPGGRAYVGPEAKVRDEDLGPGAVILRAARVAPASRVTRSIVWPKETVPPGKVLDKVVWARGEPVTIA
jgi:mannose-1-phosphate guanylyltransferase